MCYGYSLPCKESGDLAKCQILYNTIHPLWFNGSLTSKLLETGTLLGNWSMCTCCSLSVYQGVSFWTLWKTDTWVSGLSGLTEYSICVQSVDKRIFFQRKHNVEGILKECAQLKVYPFLKKIFVSLKKNTWVTENICMHIRGLNL